MPHDFYDGPVNDGGLQFDGFVEHQTDDAVLFKRPGEPAEWLPKSQIIEIKHDAIVVTPWIAEKKGWDDDDGGLVSIDDEISF